jgi:Rrf2 family protein
MLRLSKKVEYALIAMQYIATNRGRVVSAKEIAEHYDVSFEFLSKILQLLMRGQYISSQQGVSGGYMLSIDTNVVSVGEVIEAVEGRAVIVKCCGKGETQCNLQRKCSIKTPMAILQQRIDNVLYSMTIAQLAGDTQFSIVINGTPSEITTASHSKPSGRAA